MKNEKKAIAQELADAVNRAAKVLPTEELYRTLGRIEAQIDSYCVRRETATEKKEENAG